MRYVYLLVLLLCSGCNNLSNLISYSGTIVETGITNAAIKGPDIVAYPLIVRPEWRFNLNPYYGNLDFGLEGFSYVANKPESGVIAGISPMLHYSYPFHLFSPYVEAGAGPAYISFDTYEQEVAGFSFFDQVGAGLRLRSNYFALTFGYRFGHLSHGGLLRSRNRGIETHTFILGIIILI